MALSKLTKSEKIGAAGFGLGYLSIIMVAVSLILLSAIPNPKGVATILLIVFTALFLVVLPAVSIVFNVIGLHTESRNMCIAGIIISVASIVLPIILGLTGSPLSAWSLVFNLKKFL